MRLTCKAARARTAGGATTAQPIRLAIVGLCRRRRVGWRVRRSLVELLDHATAEDLLDDGAADVAGLLDDLVVVAHGRVVRERLARLLVITRA